MEVEVEGYREALERRAVRQKGYKLERSWDKYLVAPVAEPAYEVVYRNADAFTYEIRRYGERYAAQATYKGSDDTPFSLLARYIGVFGTPENEGKESIAMTAPVVREGGKPTAIAMTAPVVISEQGESKTMEFILPAEYDSISKIPKPTNPNVKIKEIPPAVGAVHRYSGSMDDSYARDMARQLAEQLKMDGVAFSEDELLQKYQFWGFCPPFTIPMFRRNEVWVELNEDDVDTLVNGATARNFN